MKIAISATGPSLDSEVDPRFGRCQYFIIADTETNNFEAIDNASGMASGGAGIATAQMIAGKGIEAVLTGNCGPNAYQVLSGAGIQVVTGVSGKIEDAINSYKGGAYSSANQANVADHFGMGGGGMGGGMGMGRGMGMGGGRGMGMGRGRGGGGMMYASPAESAVPDSTGAEMGDLGAQMQALSRQMAEIQHRLDELEKGK